MNVAPKAISGTWIGYGIGFLGEPILRAPSLLIQQFYMVFPSKCKPEKGDEIKECAQWF